ncbi:carbon-nitrogen hydrolase family protein [Clostridium estertheticum]|uniref:carbon-nitrogen hydrolase family protein n=1 Tax=Clostridium estertheticum TaxID=238834 RepID=UPI001C7CEA6B|nr:carbon-nitrogen hydrolase family protein [Clostridium estertheticum]MBX4266763.1 carbon-nitrogen hydrolase family protein [Clostridium estertheticum]WLC90547.1 carbon-nitrogen hydrolase family protein [Clostridium estertheticum]
MEVSILVGQFPILFNIEENLNNIVTILEKSEIDDLVILPEGALSGYSDDISFLENINLEILQQGLDRLKQEVINRKIHFIFGSCIYEQQALHNSAICYSYNNQDFIYKKVNLATHERGVFEAGNQLPVHKLKIMNGVVNIGIQLCREIRYPEHWRGLAINGADIFVYLTNAVIGKQSSVWRSHLISRSAENQRFLISSNNAHKNQQCPTMLIGPDGEVIEEIISNKLSCFKRTINLEEVSNWYINQMRNDVIMLVDGKATF